MSRLRLIAVGTLALSIGATAATLQAPTTDIDPTPIAAADIATAANDTLPQPSSRAVSLTVTADCDQACVADTIYDRLFDTGDPPLQRLIDAITMVDLLEGVEAISTCHTITHSLGAMAVTMFGIDTAYQVLGPVCEEGFIHGVAETAGQILDTFEPVEAAVELCRNIPSRSCGHALGHLTGGHTQGDLQRSVELCNAYRPAIDILTQDPALTDDYRNTDPFEGCVGGAMMYAQDMGKAGKGPLAGLGYVEGCLAAPDVFRNPCLSEAASTMFVRGTPPAEALRICLDVFPPDETDWKGRCLLQAGDHIVWGDSLRNPDEGLQILVDACTTLDDTSEDYCFAGGARAVARRPGWKTPLDVCGTAPRTQDCLTVLWDTHPDIEAVWKQPPAGT